MENYLEETSEGKGGFWLNWYYRILAEGRAKWSDITGKIVENMEPNQKLRVIIYWG